MFLNTYRGITYHFMAEFGFERHATIFGVTGLAMCATENTSVCACDAEEA